MSVKNTSTLFGFVLSASTLVIALILVSTGDTLNAIFWLLVAIYFTIGANMSYYGEKHDR